MLCNEGMITMLVQIAIASSVLTAQASQLELPTSSTVMNCGKPDPRETKKDGTFTCTNYYKKEVPNAKFTLKNGKLEGKALGYNEDGTPEFEGTYKNGLKDGVIKSSWSTTKKRFNVTSYYKAGKRDGVETELNDNGDGSSTVRFFKDDTETITYFMTDGKIRSVEICKINCLIPGYEKQWAMYQVQQKASAEKEVADANREVVKENRAGVVIERYHLKNSQAWGKHEQFFDNGKPYLISEEEASRVLSETEYFEDGQLKRKSKFDPKTRRELTHDEFYQNGKPKSSWVTTVNSDRTTTQKFKEYHDNGKLRSEGVRVGTIFSNAGGNYDGEIKFYGETGQLVATEHYKDQKKDGLQRSRSIYENKKAVIIDELYANGVRQKITTIDEASKKPIRMQEFMPDGSTKSDKKF
jgi:antitoxin component YwqK of YwqJK toxin-antitoxin module